MATKRTRQPSARLLATGESLQTWQADNVAVTWAQTSTDFRRVLTVMTNERNGALNRVPIPLKQASEGVMLGIQLGYEAALATLLSLTQGPPKPAPPEPEVNYPSEKDEHNFDQLNT
jgi:hypothetical protein